MSNNSRQKNRTPEPWESQPSPLCRAVKSAKRYPGHGGGGSGGGDSSGTEDSASKDDSQLLSQTSAQIDDDAGKEIASTSDAALIFMLHFDDVKFNSEIISELLSKNLLVIHKDTENGILTIKLQCDSNLSPEQKNEIIFHSSYITTRGTKAKRLEVTRWHY